MDNLCVLIFQKARKDDTEAQSVDNKSWMSESQKCITFEVIYSGAQ